MSERETLQFAIERAQYELAAGGPTLPSVCRAEHLRVLIAAAEKHLDTLPKVKTVQVWRVEYAERHHVTGDWLPCTDTWPTEEYIRRKVEDLEGRSDVACIRVTGPHDQTVPA